jgi:hypothetical protein
VNEETPLEQDPDVGAEKYDNVPTEDLKYGHLVAKLFLSGPSLLSFWQGENPVETLLKLKGSTHPSEAGAETIRGRFWCDNGVCNLIHVSDDPAEAERELKAVRLLHLLDKQAAQMPLFAPIPTPERYIAHSGISIVLELVNRVLLTTNRAAIPAVTVPPSGDAKETHHLFKAALQEMRETTADSATAAFIDAYLAGDLVAVTRMMKQMPGTKWEHFVVQCGAITRYKWNGD